MMTLYHLTGNIKTLYSIRIDGSLSKPTRILNFTRLRIKDINKTGSDYLALLFRILYTCQFSEELFTSINPNNIKSKALVIMHHISKLILAKQSMVNKDTS